MTTHQPRKRFGQHFLTDEHVIRHIITSIAPQQDDHLIEIGPGLGALTTQLLPRVKNMLAIELDRDVIAPLQTICAPLGNLTIHQGDILQFDFNTVIDKNRPMRLVGNLPYNISTPFLFHALNYSQHIKDMHFMLQKEVVARMIATPGKKDYGRLSVMLQYYCHAENLFDVMPAAFTPPPKVDSAIVKLTPYQTPPFPANNKIALEKMVRQAFSMRRKTLRNSLQDLIDAESLQTLGIDPSARPECLTVEEFVRIANTIKE